MESSWKKERGRLWRGTRIVVHTKKHYFLFQKQSQTLRKSSWDQFFFFDSVKTRFRCARVYRFCVCQRNPKFLLASLWDFQKDSAVARLLQHRLISRICHPPGEFLCDDFCASNFLKEYSVTNTISFREKARQCWRIFFFPGGISARLDDFFNNMRTLVGQFLQMCHQFIRCFFLAWPWYCIIKREEKRWSPLMINITMW